MTQFCIPSPVFEAYTPERIRELVNLNARFACEVLVSIAVNDVVNCSRKESEAGQGFNGYDRKFGRDLADKAAKGLASPKSGLIGQSGSPISYKQNLYIKRLARKYSGQVLAEINVGLLPPLPAAPVSTKVVTRRR